MHSEMQVAQVSPRTPLTPVRDRGSRRVGWRGFPGPHPPHDTPTASDAGGIVQECRACGKKVRNSCECEAMSKCECGCVRGYTLTLGHGRRTVRMIVVFTTPQLAYMHDNERV